MLSEAAVLLAGATRMPAARFASACALGNLALALAYAGAGALSASWDAPWLAVAAAVVLPGVGMVVVRGR